MKLFFVSFMLLFRTMYTLDSVDFKDLNNSSEDIQDKHLSSNITIQTERDMGLNDNSLTLNNIREPSSSNSDNTIKKYVDYSDFITDLSKTISSKLAEILRNKMKSLLNKPSSKDPTNDLELNNVSRNSKQMNSVLNKGHLGKNTEEFAVASGAVPEMDVSKKLVESRQFVFHPYLPYGEETSPDEKISFQDVLPIKMVKFIKSMVEDANWEAMFMKMVRMVVDQFVDKIIEKMFAHKEEDEGKWRSVNDEKPSPWMLLRKSLTSVARLRRSIAESKSGKETDWDSSSFSQSNRLSKNDDPKVKEASENESWLDSVLEYLFPDDESEEVPEEYSEGKRLKRDVESVKQVRMEDILHTFLMKYLDFSEGKSPSEEVQQTVQASIPLKIFPESGNQLEVSTQVEDPKKPNADRQSNSALPERWSKLLHMQKGSSDILKRTRRSDNGRESKRLWQEGQRSRPTSLKSRDECSLRKACNAGRLLSRLPSVQDLTLQLKEYGNEPHWDALLWGMEKKRCSKIFCKRQRSPKGSKHSWGNPPQHQKLLRKRADSIAHPYRTHKTHGVLEETR